MKQAAALGVIAVSFEVLSKTSQEDPALMVPYEFLFLTTWYD